MRIRRNSKQLENPITQTHLDSADLPELEKKLEQLQEKLVQEKMVTQKLRENSCEIINEMREKNEMIEQLKIENSGLKKSINDLKVSMSTKQKMAEGLEREIREENQIMKDRNNKLCDIVEYLEGKTESLEKTQKQFKIVEEGLRKRISQLESENEIVRRKMAKFEVDSEKYKLKALEGEKYWSNKLEKNKLREQENRVENYLDVKNKHEEELFRAKADLIRFEKIFRQKDEQIKSLEGRICEILALNNGN